MEEFGVELYFLELLGDLAFCLRESAVYMKKFLIRKVWRYRRRRRKRKWRRRRRILKIREGVFFNIEGVFQAEVAPCGGDGGVLLI